MKPGPTSADATLSFADFKPTLGSSSAAQVAIKGGPDATVSLAETPARVQVSGARAGLPGLGGRPRAATQSKTLFGLQAVTLPMQPREQAVEARPSAPEPEKRKAASAAQAAVAVAPSAADVSQQEAPEEGFFAAKTPPANPLPSILVREQDNDRTQDVSLSDISLIEARANPVPPPRTANALSADGGADPFAVEPAGGSAREPSFQAERRHTPSTEPAPRPRSALKYGLWAAVPVGLCAAWFAWRAPMSDSNAASVPMTALKAEEHAPPVIAAAAPSAPAAVVAAPEAVPSPAPAAVEAPSPEAPAAEVAPGEATAGAVPANTADEGAAVEPNAEPAPTAAAEADPDAEDVDVEVDAARKGLALRADKLVNEGHALRRKKKLAPARTKYRDALALYPGYPRALAGLVQVSIQQRDGKAAVNMAKQLVKLRPTQVSYQVLLGDAYKVAGKPGLAKEAWHGAARKGSAAAKARLGN